MQKGNTLGSQVCLVSTREEKNCAIFICPYREKAVATIPAIDLNPREKIRKIFNRFPFLK